MRIAFYTLACACFFHFSTVSYGQGGELGPLVTKLQQLVMPVQTGSKNHEPKISFLEPAVIRYSYVETDQKGNKVSYAYEFNLADIDPYAVREETQRDKITVVLAVRNKQKLVKVYQDEEVQPYDDEVNVLAKDIENARAIGEAVKEAIPRAEKIMAGRLKLSGYDAMVDWLAGHVKNVELGKTAFRQSLVKGDYVGSLRLTQKEETERTSTEEVYSFNLADINVNTINYKITGNKFAIHFETLQGAKYIAVRRDGETRPYVDELTIATNNVDEARDLKTVLALVVPLAQEKVKADMPAVASGKDAVARIGTLAKEITIGTKQISQELGSDCSCSLTQVEKDTKSSEKNFYTFNWIDVNPAASKINVTADRMFIEIVTHDSRDLIRHSVDDEFKGYENEMRLYMPDAETARRASYVLDKVVEKCKASYKEPFGDDVSSLTTWIRANITDVTVDDVTVKQTLEPAEAGQDNKMKFTRREVDSKGGGAGEVYEFSLQDIDPRSVAVDVRSKWLYVTMQTNFKEKIIKYYKDGKIQPYTSGIEFAISTVDISRDMVSALQKVIKTLKPE